MVQVVPRCQLGWGQRGCQSGSRLLRPEPRYVHCRGEELSMELDHERLATVRVATSVVTQFVTQTRPRPSGRSWYGRRLCGRLRIPSLVTPVR